MSNVKNEKSALPLFVLHGHSSSVLCCSFYPSNSYQSKQSSLFLSGDVDGSVILWNLTTRQPIANFSVLEEARRQALERAAHQGQATGEDERGEIENPPASSMHPGALGPHSRSVLSVGFIPTCAAQTLPNERKGAYPVGKQGVQATEPSLGKGLVTSDALDVSNNAVALAASGGRQDGPQRQRFRLTRRPASRISGATSSAPSAESASDAQNTLLSQPSFASNSNICFYTHCRDQRVYVWSYSRAAAASTSTAPSLQLLAAVTAPQHGFCPVESMSETTDGLSTTYLAVPHDARGEITVWELAWKGDMNDTRLPDVEGKAVANPKAACATKSIDEGSESDAEDADDDVDTTGMNPMDALIARAAAQERRDEKRRLKQRKGSAKMGCGPAVEHESDTDNGADAFESAANAVVANAERASFLCYVAPFATTRTSGFSVRRLCRFSACPRFKGGTIMRLTMCADARRLAVAFESGHIVLAQFRRAGGCSLQSSTESDCADKSAVAKRLGSDSAVQEVPFSSHVRCAIRAFAESALACCWNEQRVLACSADGGLHCYEAIEAPRDCNSDDAPSSLADNSVQLQLLWSATLRKGIGSICIQANLIIAGCWDSTLRLYDARDGRLVSILSYQQETINEVRIAPSAIARVAAFGFDPRQPRCYAPLSPHEVVPPQQLSISGPQNVPGGSTAAGNMRGTPESTSAATMLDAARDIGSSRGRLQCEEELVYLFGSASKDGSVAIWRVDMQLISERVALQLLL